MSAHLQATVTDILRQQPVYLGAGRKIRCSDTTKKNKKKFADWYAKPENREAVRKRVKQYSQDNKAKILKRKKKYYQKNRQKEIDRQARLWATSPEHRERKKRLARERYARKKKEKADGLVKETF